MSKFGYTILYVRNVELSIQFYEAAFGITRKFISPDFQYGELSTGGTTLTFASLELAGSNLPDGFTESSNDNKPFAIEIGFITEDVEETVALAVKAGATLLTKPKTKPWGQTVAYVRDPDGFLVEICTPMS